MSVLALTIFVSFLLVATFVALFWFQHTRSWGGGADRDSLLPLEGEGRVEARGGARREGAAGGGPSTPEAGARE